MSGGPGRFRGTQATFRPPCHTPPATTIPSWCHKGYYQCNLLQNQVHIFRSFAPIFFVEVLFLFCNFWGICYFVKFQKFTCKCSYYNGILHIFEVFGLFQKFKCNTFNRASRDFFYTMWVLYLFSWILFLFPEKIFVPYKISPPPLTEILYPRLL